MAVSPKSLLGALWDNVRLALSSQAAGNSYPVISATSVWLGYV